MDTVDRTPEPESTDAILLDLLEGQERFNFLYDVLREKGCIQEKDCMMIEIKSMIARSERLLRLRKSTGKSVVDLETHIAQLKDRLEVLRTTPVLVSK